MDLSKILVIIGVVTALTNIVVQVLKKATWDKLPTNILVVIVAELLTTVSFAGYLDYTNTAGTWWMWAACVVAGILVAYAAMFGFDKLREVLEGVTGHAGK